MLGEDIIHIIKAYTPQVGSDESVEKFFWEEIDGLMQEIPHIILTPGQLINLRPSFQAIQHALDEAISLVL